MKERLTDRIKAMPKIDLHCHLDGSMTLESVERILGRRAGAEELQARERCRDLAEYLDRFRLPLQCIQTEAGLRTAAREFLLDVAGENIRYIEVRFAPLSSVHEGLDCRRLLI